MSITNIKTFVLGTYIEIMYSILAAACLGVQLKRRFDNFMFYSIENLYFHRVIINIMLFMYKHTVYVHFKCHWYINTINICISHFNYADLEYYWFLFVSCVLV